MRRARRRCRGSIPAPVRRGRGGLLRSSPAHDWPCTVTALDSFHYGPPRWQARNEVVPMLHGRPVAVLGGVRIPFCRQNTAYSDVGNLGMSVRTLGALVEKFGLHGQQLGEVAMGAVIKHPSDFNLGREATLSSGLSPLTPGITLQRACGTSLDALRSEEHTSELQSLMRISYAVFCLKKKNENTTTTRQHAHIRVNKTDQKEKK